MRFSRCFLLLPLLAVLMQAQTPSLESRRKAFNDLLAEQWEYSLRTSPEFASILGDKRFNDQLSDLSLKSIKQREEDARAFLVRFQAIDTTGFPDQDLLSHRIMIRDLEHNLEGVRFKDYEMPVNQMGGLHLNAAQFPSMLSFTNEKDYRDYITRLHKLPLGFDQTMELMRAGLKDNLMPPRFLLEKVVTQAAGLAAMKPEDSPFAEPLKKMPDTLAKETQDAIRRDLLSAIAKDVLPAYTRFSVFVRDEYAPKGRTDVGVSALPNGPAYYAYQVREATTTLMSPEEIHQLGLSEVARIEAEQLTIAKKLGFSDLKTFRAAVNSDPKLHVASGEDILDKYRKFTDGMYNKLPEYFGRLPKGRMKVEKTEAFREKEAAGAEYAMGTPDGSRPGRVQVNTYEWEKRTTPEIESTAYHEGVPGHHMQIAIAQELPALPPFRQHEFYIAYTEGWALYTEGLAKDMGFYQDPYSDYGRLDSEMLRAIRLVLDTGVHFKHWTRQQMVDFFHAHSNVAESEVQAETDRYISWPSQALGYKIGQLTILRLREHAKKELGPKFNIRHFHDEVLGGGALPLDVLGERIDAWIAREKQAAAPSAGV
ncbi:MAG: DUF885 domain-containing protein [Bryobacteraceae bacterium]